MAGSWVIFGVWLGETEHVLREDMKREWVGVTVLVERETCLCGGIVVGGSD